ncbi:hypothetical protein [Microbacterium sp. A93]|uniref:hypothetical protein n=1 Tax=Microbacterium sp. A93 TaxID=3450716 RepID=UPI003F444E57
MAAFTDLVDLIPALRGRCDEAAFALPSTLRTLDDDTVVAVLTQAAELAKQVEHVILTAAGVVALRSTRGAGHSGLAQSRGHRSAESLIQGITGSTRAEAARAARVGSALLDDGSAPVDDDAETTGAGSGASFDSGSDAGVDSENEADSGDQAGPDHETDFGSGREDAQPAAAPRNWHAPLSHALINGTITAAQHDAIRRGLGEPPTIDSNSFSSEADAAQLAQIWREAWQLAAEQLIIESAERTVEELGSAARTIRDRLDPDGAAARFEQRYARRSFRM